MKALRCLIALCLLCFIQPVCSASPHTNSNVTTGGARDVITIPQNAYAALLTLQLDKAYLMRSAGLTSDALLSHGRSAHIMHTSPASRCHKQKLFHS